MIVDIFSDELKAAYDRMMKEDKPSQEQKSQFTTIEKGKWRSEIIDILSIMDKGEPIILKRPLLPHTPASYKLPLYVNYMKQINDWPDEAYYHLTNVLVRGVLINGRKFIYVDGIPKRDEYSIISEGNITWIVMGIDLTTLWQYERIEVVLTGGDIYSMYGSRDPDGEPNPPMMLSVPDIKEKADALKYSKFSFKQIKVNYIKESQSIYYYGGEITLSLRCKEKDELRDFPLGRYIINQIKHGMDEAELSAIDFRYLLNAKFPTETFTKGETPDTGLFLEDDYIDKIKPVMLGIGNGVPGIPINGLQIYQYPVVDLNKKITFYEYQFPPGWLGNPLKIEVKQGESWNEIYPGLGNPQFNEKYQNPHPAATAPKLDSDTGIIKIYYGQALQDGEYGNGMNEVRMYAKWPNSLIEQAISFLLDSSGNLSLKSGFMGEFNNLAPIGLYMDSSEPIFTWIERLQSTNIIGGQLMLINDLLFFRLENPNRIKKFDIPNSDVLNHEKISVSLADDFIYSGWDISYKKAWAGGDDTDGHNIGTNYRYPTASIYNSSDLTTSFEYTSPQQQKYDTFPLQQRVNIIRDMIATFRHRIEGVEIPITFDYMELLVYDVIGYTPKALALQGHRFMEWIIYEKNINFKKETITLSMVERVKTQNWNNGNQ